MSKWQDRDLNPGSLIPEPACLPTISFCLFDFLLHSTLQTSSFFQDGTLISPKLSFFQ